MITSDQPRVAVLIALGAARAGANLRPVKRAGDCRLAINGPFSSLACES
jgi:hypothetical protein